MRTAPATRSGDRRSRRCANREMTRRYDVVVIGSGTAASTVASRCRAAGWTVAVVDSRPFGGTCALRGCDPKKILVGAAEAVEWVRRLSDKGVESTNTQIDWSRLVAFKRSLIADVPRSREAGFLKRGIDAFHGRSTFSGPTTVMIGDDVLEGRYVVIAAGARPATRRISGAEHLVTSEQLSSSVIFHRASCSSAVDIFRSSLPMSPRVLAQRLRSCIAATVRSRHSIRTWSSCLSRERERSASTSTCEPR